MIYLYGLLSFILCVSFACGAGAEADAVEAPVRQVTSETPAPDSTTRRLFAGVMEMARARALHERPLGEVMQAVGLHFAGTPYVAGTLDEPAEETLVVDLGGYDCVTFVETALALARGIVQDDYTYATFLDHLRSQRYRGGRLDGYGSRLHYFSEWIADNEARGAVENLTRALGGERLDKRLTFMSAHRDSYPRLAASDSLYERLRAVEADLADLELYVIPQARIRAVYDQLQAGDIVATATPIEGLDVTHTGLVYAGADGRKGLLHASTSGGVKVSPDLQTYVENNRSQLGIVVARPVDLRQHP